MEGVFVDLTPQMLDWRNSARDLLHVSFLAYPTRKGTKQKQGIGKLVWLAVHFGTTRQAPGTTTTNDGAARSVAKNLRLESSSRSTRTTWNVPQCRLLFRLSSGVSSAVKSCEQLGQRNLPHNLHNLARQHLRRCYHLLVHASKINRDNRAWCHTHSTVCSP